MKKPDIPANEPGRIAALCGLDILDTPTEERFDRITRIAQRHFAAPIVLISLVDSGRQWFKSRQGLDATETPRDISFCGHAILSDQILYIPDALADERFSDNPLVTGAPFVRFYAGAPLHAPDGQRIGTLCIIDHRSREFSRTDLEVLRDLADCVEEEFRRSSLLELTQSLRDQEQRFRSLFDTIVDGIIVIDVRGRIQTVNPAAETLFGYSAEEVQGKYVQMLMPQSAGHHDDGPPHFIAGGERKSTGLGREVIGRRKDGSLFPVELTVGEMEVKGTRMFTGIVRDISERKRAEEELQSITALRQAILDSANFSIISTAIDGTILSFNHGAERMLGYSAAELVGKTTPAILHDMGEVARRAEELTAELNEDIAPGFEAFVAKARLGTPDEREWTYIRKNGTRFPVLLSITAVWNAEGKIIGFLGIGSDITERKKVERMKSEFISTVSHELRTPLTSIKGALGLVLGRDAEWLPENVRGMLEMAERNSERLTLLINDILDLEKIRAARLEFDLKLVNLVAVATQAVEDNEGYAREHQVKLVLDPQLTQAPVRADENRLMQVFANLISNAVKYSSKDGRVVVSVAEHGDEFRVEVRDHGSGIPEEFRSRIFQRFAQADSSDSRRKGGTGLGLSIAKAIVEHHDGKIGYTSEPGVATVFYFQLPRFGIGQHRRSGDKSHRPRAVAGVRALICENNSDVAQIIAAMVEQQDGIACDIAVSATEARALLERQAYRVLLLDPASLGQDGVGFLREVGGNPLVAQLPVVVVSDHADEGRTALGAEYVNVVAWIRKPVGKERLEEALQKALKRSNRPHILHVEDDPDVLEVTRALLEDSADLTYVTSLRDARRQLATRIFDLTILDLGLPDGSGTELLDELQGRSPVVIFSAQVPSREVASQAAVALTKSMTSNEQLLEAIKEILALTDGRQQASIKR